jgi:hypothetical protein
MLLRRFRLQTLLVLFLAMTPLASAQEKPEHEDRQIKPIYVTTRIFQIQAKRGSYEELSNQIFKIKSSGLPGHEKWLRALGKTYPGFEASLLRTETRKVFRTSKPTVLSLIRQVDGRSLDIHLNGAQSPGDGVTPGTTLISEISLHFGDDRNKKPVTYAIQPMEVESGMSYFYAASSMKLIPPDYVKFIRPAANIARFEGNDLYLVFAFSVDLEKDPQPARYVDERQSVALQERAVKKVMPELSASTREYASNGVVRVIIEIGPDGKVTAAQPYASTYPEMNQEAVSAAMQWEFPANLFANDKTPITGFLTFNLDSQEAGKKETAPGTAKQ